MTHLSLFSGIGGTTIAAEKAGFRTIGHFDNDPFCRAVLSKRFGGDVRGDVTRDGFEDFVGTHVVSATFPCQDTSVAKRDAAGVSGPRSGLFREAVRAVRVVRPRFLVLENVAALVNRGLDEVLGALAEEGHDAQWDCVSACEFGAPHTRERLFVVSHPEGFGRERGWGPGSLAAALEPAGLRSQYRWPGASEPRPVGVAYGSAGRVDRLKALGNHLCWFQVAPVFAALAEAAPA